MLKRLFIQNVALIERAEIEFSERLNVLSGETGAGKSISSIPLTSCSARKPTEV